MVKQPSPERTKTFFPGHDLRDKAGRMGKNTFEVRYNGFQNISILLITFKRKLSKVTTKTDKTMLLFQVINNLK